MRCFIIVMTVLMLLRPAMATAQAVDFSVAVESLSYHGDDYRQTSGKLALTCAVDYQFHPEWRVGTGVSVGTFDYPSSGRGFTAFTVFGQATRLWQASQRATLFAGGRAGFEHEGAGPLAPGPGGYGDASVTVSMLHLGRGLGPDAISHNGQRTQIGGRIGMRW